MDKIDFLRFLYGAQNKTDIPNWQTLHEFDNISKNKSFDGKVYKQGNKIVISYAGSEEPNDYLNSAQIIKTKTIPSQYYDAENLYNNVRKRYPKSDIEFTGYSLGASLSNLMSHRTGLPSNTLESIGSKHIAESHPNYFKYDGSNINTYGRQGDYLFYSNINKQSGNIYIIPDIPQDQVHVDRDNLMPQHMLHGIQPYDLYRAKPYTPKGQTTGQAAPVDFGHIFTPAEIGNMSDEDFERHEHTITKQASQGLIQPQRQSQAHDFTGWKNPFNGDNRIFTRESIGEMSDDEFENHEKAIGAQLGKIGIPTNNEVQNSFGAVYVAPYTRSDGVQVRGHYRSR